MIYINAVSYLFKKTRAFDLVFYAFLVGRTWDTFKFPCHVFESDLWTHILWPAIMLNQF